MNWEKLETISDFDNLKMQTEQSSSAFVVFKHSSRCIISKMALRRFESEYTQPSPFFLVDVINNRDVSNYIASELKVQHQSPQVVVLRKGKAIYNASHERIEAKTVATVL